MRGAGLPVRMIRLEVVAGPDTGRSLSSSDDVSVGTASHNHLVLKDPTVSRYHLEVRRRGDRFLVVDLGSTNGTEVGPALLQATSATVPAGTILGLGETRLRIDDGEVHLVAPGPERLGDLRGRHPSMRRLMAMIQRVAKSDVPVLVLGESGTGKELIARAIHDESGRADEPFVTFDCGAIPPTLVASELFGHERGAFTGADRRRIGALERAGQGTVFLDEIGELPAEIQSTLLGALERRRVTRLGGDVEIAIEARVVSATHRDIRAEVNAGGFRLDLFYRLAVVTLNVPPLRERTEDIPLLVQHFLDETGASLTAEAVFRGDKMEELSRHTWPGNVRELRNVVLGALALGDPPALGLTERAQTAAPDRDPVGAVLSLPYREARQVVVEDFERRYLDHILGATGGNVRAAAREARMDRSYLMELMKRHRPR